MIRFKLKCNEFISSSTTLRDLDTNYSLAQVNDSNVTQQEHGTNQRYLVFKIFI